MRRIVKRPAAKRDLTQHFVWFAEEANFEVARRFLQAAEKSFQDLAAMPRMGPLKVHPSRKIRGESSRACACGAWRTSRTF
jgi:plasmid stabilization system protein ParE